MNLGREIGRFIYGAYGIEVSGSENVIHSHSGDVLKVMTKNFIGTIRNGHNILSQEYYFITMAKTN